MSVRHRVDSWGQAGVAQARGVFQGVDVSKAGVEGTVGHVSEVFFFFSPGHGSGYATCQVAIVHTLEVVDGDLGAWLGKHQRSSVVHEFVCGAVREAASFATSVSAEL